MTLSKNILAAHAAGVETALAPLRVPGDFGGRVTEIARAGTAQVLCQKSVLLTIYRVKKYLTGSIGHI